MCPSSHTHKEKLFLKACDGHVPSVSTEAIVQGKGGPLAPTPATTGGEKTEKKSSGLWDAP